MVFFLFCHNGIKYIQVDKNRVKFTDLKYLRFYVQKKKCKIIDTLTLNLLLTIVKYHTVQGKENNHHKFHYKVEISYHRISVTTSWI